MKVIPKAFTREFPVMFCEIWGKCFKYFWGTEPKIFPKNIFIIKNGLVEDYRNPDLNKELLQLFYVRSKGKRNFFKDFYSKSLKEFGSLKKYSKKSFLSKVELIEYAQKIQEFWPSMYAALFIPLDKRFAKKDRELMIKLRSKIDVFGDEATETITKSLIYHYPSMGDLVFYIRLKDLQNEAITKKSLEKVSRSKLIMIDDEVVSEKKLKKLSKKYQFKLEELNTRGMKFLTGQTAFTGKVRGRVQLVLKKSQVSKFTAGRILVSAMTMPDYLPAMRKAAAFVTDEGGITSHAAIVAREFKKPCIVGTKIATKVFKDGDLVEVDANKGIVRKIK